MSEGLPPSIDRFRTVLKLLHSVNEKLLLDREFLISMIRAAGLRDFGGGYDPYAEEKGGLLQDPHQFADTLRLLAGHRIQTVLEIGSWNGHSICFMTAVLRRFNPDIQSLSVDPVNVPWDSHGQPVRYVSGTSDNFRSQVFDLVIIDGDHTYSWVVRDYDNVGRAARLCMFHDIDDADFNIFDPGNYWEHLKKVEPDSQFHEFKHPSRHYMGIGVRVKTGG
jgi:hypothetical protein